MKILLRFLILLPLVATPAAADYKKGMEAHSRGDYATALREWRPLAEEGNADAQYNLGFMYENAQGVTQNHAEAMKWYTKAVGQGHA